MAERANKARALLVDAFLTLSARPWRSLAMMAGVMLALASAVTALLLADTQKAQIDKRFDAQRASVAVLQSTQGTAGQFDLEGLTQLRRFDPVEAAGELSIWKEQVSLTLTGMDAPVDAALLGADSEILTALGTSVLAGSGLDAAAGQDGSPLVWLGNQVAPNLRPETLVGLTVRVDQTTYTIGGVLRAPPGYAYVNTSLIIGPARAESDFGSPARKRALIKVRPGSAAVVAAYAVDALDATGRFGLRDVTPPDGRILMGTVARDLRTIGIALGSLIGVIGVISIANTLSMAVYQRSRELGLRAAMGWTRRRIAALIITESFVAGLLASVLGSFLGILLAAAWCLVQGWELIMDPTLPAAATTFGVTASIVGGLVPSMRAAGISPLEAMRS
jgi:putative ABC transport system permease protein